MRFKAYHCELLYQVSRFFSVGITDKSLKRSTHHVVCKNSLNIYRRLGKVLHWRYGIFTCENHMKYLRSFSSRLDGIYVKYLYIYIH